MGERLEYGEDTAELDEGIQTHGKCPDEGVSVRDEVCNDGAVGEERERDFRKEEHDREGKRIGLEVAGGHFAVLIGENFYGRRNGVFFTIRRVSDRDDHSITAFSLFFDLKESVTFFIEVHGARGNTTHKLIMRLRARRADRSILLPK